MGRIPLVFLSASLLILSATCELQHRQRENFQYSSSSRKVVNGKVVDDDSKSGYLRKQTGNMGGNYEEQENMDAEAQRKREELLRWAHHGEPFTAPALGPMGIPTFMTGSSSASQMGSNQLSRITSGMAFDDCEPNSGLGTSSSHSGMHRAESASQYASRSESSRIVPVVTPVQVGAVNIDNARYRDANRLTDYGVLTRPISNMHSVHQQAAASDRYAASESRSYPSVVPRPIIQSQSQTQSQSQSAAMHHQYSASQIEEPQRTIPATYSSTNRDASSSQYQRQDERRYDSAHDERRDFGRSPYQTEELRAAESQHYGHKYEEEAYNAPTIRAPYGGKSEIDRRVSSLDHTVESLNRRTGTTDRNSILPATQVFDDYDDDQQQVQQTYSAAASSASAYAQQQSSRDILGRSGNTGSYNSGYQQQYRPRYNTASRTSGIQSASSTLAARSEQESRYNDDRQTLDRSYAAGSRNAANDIGQEASDLLGAVGAGIPGGSYRQESGDSMSYGYRDAGTFGEDRSDGVRGTYTRDGNVAAQSKQAEEMREENGRVKFSSEGSYSKKHEYSENRNFEFPAGSAVNPLSQSEVSKTSTITNA